MKEVGLYKAKTQLSALVVSVAESGECVALTRHGKVVAELHPPAGKAPKRGCLKSARFRMARDFDADGLGFEDFWGEAKGRYKIKARTRK